jgi:hypothetical protein
VFFCLVKWQGLLLWAAPSPCLTGSQPGESNSGGERDADTGAVDKEQGRSVPRGEGERCSRI